MSCCIYTAAIAFTPTFCSWGHQLHNYLSMSREAVLGKARFGVRAKATRIMAMQDPKPLVSVRSYRPEDFAHVKRLFVEVGVGHIFARASGRV